MVLRSCLSLLFIAFPCILISTISKFSYHKSQRRSFRSVSASTMILLIFVPILFLPILALSEKDSTVEIHEASELEDLKLKVSDLEFIIHKNNNILMSKVTQLAENSRQIKGMEVKIESLKNTIQKMKNSSGDASYSEVRMRNMEEEVGHLWAALRKNNFNIHILGLNARENEEKLIALISKVRKMESVISEQWVQIQQVEQALLLIKKRVQKISMGKNNVKSTVSRFIADLQKHHLPKALDWLGLSAYTKRNATFRFKAMLYLKKIISKVRDFHHEVQYSIKHAMKNNGSTANLVNDEFIFFLASALIISPMLIAFQLITG
ncbi:hypothetical protein ZOSMA_148G00330 [Zostera marina]|uniref:Uncharacterized protein n=1 Tax=Zostera marina TaxID=29655 RepID=A0A0K9PX27_ZOSMR|nr:hypothetical protein ZOSMA_148G00330 [Zostera marina]